MRLIKHIFTLTFITFLPLSIETQAISYTASDRVVFSDSQAVLNAFCQKPHRNCRETFILPNYVIPFTIRDIITVYAANYSNDTSAVFEKTVKTNVYSANSLVNLCYQYGVFCTNVEKINDSYYIVNYFTRTMPDPEIDMPPKPGDRGTTE